MTGKAVILARGLGTRMQRAGGEVGLGADQEQIARQGLKALMTLHGRPLLDYIVDGLLGAGVGRLCLVVAPEAGLMREHARRIQEAAGVPVECAVQSEPLGTADAVLASEGFAGDEPFILCNGDDVYPAEALAALVRVQDRDCWVAAFDRDDLEEQGNIAAERVRELAVVTATPEGRLRAIVEKPAEPGRYARDGRVWVNMNLYRFTPVIFGACREIDPDPVRGELELTAAVNRLAESGDACFRVLPCRGGVLDLTSRADVRSAARALAGRRLCF